MSSILALKNVIKDFGGLRAVNDLSFTVKSGEIHGLIGPNGSGKTTVFNLITRHIPCTSGNIIMDGCDIANERIDKIIGYGIARTFQGSRNFQNISLVEAMLTACYHKSKITLFQSILNTPSTKREKAIHTEHVMDILKFIGLENRTSDLAGSLPYAHQSLLGIGMALASEPKLLLLDEPIAGMNAQETRETMELITKINERGITVLLVEHNMTAVMGICKEIVVISSGKKIAEGRPEQITEDPAVIKAYLGDNVYA